MGFEPMTPCLQGRCSPSWATPPYCCLRQWYLLRRWYHFVMISLRMISSLSLGLYHYLNNGFLLFLQKILQNWTTNRFVPRQNRLLCRIHACDVWTILHRKEVIQPHLPIRLPCYDLTPIIEPTFDCCLLAVSSQASGVPNFHGLTGGVYKARERIHRGMLIRDY